MESDTLAPGTLVAGRYRIVRELGRGGMGAVYVVEHVNTGGRWALKVMLDCTRIQAERATRFRREARASARITSDHVVKVTDADTAPELDGAPFLVMELLEGEDVERLLQRRGKLPPFETIEILTQVARGLDRAHAAGVIHRDLKPENVFMHRRDDGSEIVKILDFGISKVLRPDGDLSTASVTGGSEMMGTPLYMAPEQASPRHDVVGPATDVWAIGLMTVRMLTGSIYWTGETIPEVFLQIMSERRTPPSSRWTGLSPGFDAWFLKSVALRAADRFQSVGEQIAELSLLLTGARVAPRPLTPVPPRPGDPQPTLGSQVTQPIAELRDHSSSRAAIGLSVSTTAGPVSRSALPMRPTRGIAIGAALVVALGAAIVAVPLLRTRGSTAVTVDAAGAGALGTEAVASASASAPAVTATSNAEANANAEASVNAEANAKANANAKDAGGRVVATRPPVRVIAPPVVSAAASVAAPRPADLFDTPK